MIKFKYSKPLDDIFSEIASQKFPGWVKPEKAFVLGKIKEYQLIWDKEIAPAVRKVLNKYEYVFPVVTAYVMSGTHRCISDPIIIKSRFTKDEFISVIIEEYLHNVAVENYKIDRSFSIPKKFKDEPQQVKNHIVIFPLFKEILKELGRPDLYELSKKERDHGNYKKAFELIEKAE